MARARRTRARRGKRTAWKVGLLALVSITLITLDYRGQLRGPVSGARRVASDVVSPLTGAVDDVLHPIGSFFAGAVNYGSLQQQNAKLRLELRKRSAAQAAVQRLQSELDQLTALDKLPWASALSVPTVVAEVAGTNASNFDETVVLNKGTADGVDKGMPVVDGKGLVGQVVAATAHQATVQLVTDARTVVSVTYGTAGALASVDGGGPGSALSVQYVNPGTVLHRGMVLTTSSQALATLPAGIPVARITAYRSDPSATAESVQAQPVARLSNLGYVDVLQWEPPG